MYLAFICGLCCEAVAASVKAVTLPLFLVHFIYGFVFLLSAVGICLAVLEVGDLMRVVTVFP